MQPPPLRTAESYIAAAVVLTLIAQIWFRQHFEALDEHAWAVWPLVAFRSSLGCSRHCGGRSCGTDPIGDHADDRQALVASSSSARAMPDISAPTTSEASRISMREPGMAIAAVSFAKCATIKVKPHAPTQPCVRSQ